MMRHIIRLVLPVAVLAVVTGMLPVLPTDIGGRTNQLAQLDAIVIPTGGGGGASLINGNGNTQLEQRFDERRQSGDIDVVGGTGSVVRPISPDPSYYQVIIPQTPTQPTGASSPTTGGGSPVAGDSGSGSGTASPSTGSASTPVIRPFNQVLPGVDLYQGQPGQAGQVIQQQFNQQKTQVTEVRSLDGFVTGTGSDVKAPFNLSGCLEICDGVYVAAHGECQEKSPNSDKLKSCPDAAFNTKAECEKRCRDEAKKQAGSGSAGGSASVGGTQTTVQGGLQVWIPENANLVTLGDSVGGVVDEFGPVVLLPGTSMVYGNEVACGSDCTSIQIAPVSIKASQAVAISQSTGVKLQVQDAGNLLDSIAVANGILGREEVETTSGAFVVPGAKSTALGAIGQGVVGIGQKISSVFNNIGNFFGGLLGGDGGGGSGGSGVAGVTGGGLSATTENSVTGGGGGCGPVNQLSVDIYNANKRQGDASGGLQCGGKCKNINETCQVVGASDVNMLYGRDNEYALKGKEGECACVAGGGSVFPGPEEPKKPAPICRISEKFEETYTKSLAVHVSFSLTRGERGDYVAPVTTCNSEMTCSNYERNAEGEITGCSAWSEVTSCETTSARQEAETQAAFAARVDAEANKQARAQCEAMAASEMAGQQPSCSLTCVKKDADGKNVCEPCQLTAKASYSCGYDQSKPQPPAVKPGAAGGKKYSFSGTFNMLAYKTVAGTMACIGGADSVEDEKGGGGSGGGGGGDGGGGGGGGGGNKPTAPTEPTQSTKGKPVPTSTEVPTVGDVKFGQSCSGDATLNNCSASTDCGKGLSCGVGNVGGQKGCYCFSASVLEAQLQKRPEYGKSCGDDANACPADGCKKLAKDGRGELTCASQNGKCTCVTPTEAKKATTTPTPTNTGIGFVNSIVGIPGKIGAFVRDNIFAAIFGTNVSEVVLSCRNTTATVSVSAAIVYNASTCEESESVGISSCIKSVTSQYAARSKAACNVACAAANTDVDSCKIGSPNPDKLPEKVCSAGGCASVGNSKQVRVDGNGSWTIQCACGSAGGTSGGGDGSTGGGGGTNPSPSAGGAPVVEPPEPSTAAPETVENGPDKECAEKSVCGGACLSGKGICTMSQPLIKGEKPACLCVGTEPDTVTENPELTDRPDFITACEGRATCGGTCLENTQYPGVCSKSSDGTCLCVGAGETSGGGVQGGGEDTGSSSVPDDEEAPAPVGGADDDDIDEDEEAPAPVGSVVDGGKKDDDKPGIFESVNSFVQSFAYTLNPFRFFADINAGAVKLVTDESCRIKGDQLKELGLTSKKEGENKVYYFKGEKIHVKDKSGKITERVAVVEAKYEAAYKSFCGGKSCGAGGTCQQGSDGLCNVCKEEEEEAPAPSVPTSPDAGKTPPPAGGNQPKTPPVNLGPFENCQASVSDLIGLGLVNAVGKGLTLGGRPLDKIPANDPELVKFLAKYDASCTQSLCKEGASKCEINTGTTDPAARCHCADGSTPTAPTVPGSTPAPKPATPAKCPNASEGAVACKAGTCEGGTCQFTPERCTKAFDGTHSCLPASCGCVPSVGGVPSVPTVGGTPKPPAQPPVPPELPVPVSKITLDGCQLTSAATGFEFPKSGPNAGMIVFKDAKGTSNVVMSVAAFKALSADAQKKVMESTKTSTGKSIADEANERGKAVCENGTNTCKNSATKCKFEPKKESLLDRCYCPTATPPPAAPSTPAAPTGGTPKPPVQPPVPPVTPVPAGQETEASCGESAKSTGNQCSQSLCDSSDGTGTQLKCVRSASVTYGSPVVVSCSCRNPKCYFFTTNWCGNCPAAKARLAALNKKCIVIDGDADPKKLGDKYGVKGYPTVVDVDENGNKVDSYDPRTR